ncbi:MAG: hypothetical protein UHU21_14995, partial [Lachnospiraceae bacterium]|nr:hypothetical protein [Lachnospiraceae bacterium]
IQMETLPVKKLEMTDQRIRKRLTRRHPARVTRIRNQQKILKNRITKMKTAMFSALMEAMISPGRSLPRSSRFRQMSGRDLVIRLTASWKGKKTSLRQERLLFST